MVSPPGDINATVQAAIGGQAAGDVYENGSDRHFPMIVRLAPRYRENIEAIRRIPIGVQGSKRRHPDAAERSGDGGARVGRLLHLPRAAGALRPDQVQRARPRPRQRRPRGPAAGGRAGQDPGRLPPRMGRRVRQPQECAAAAGGRRADRHRADPAAALHQLRLAARHAARRQRHSDGADRRHPQRCSCYRHAVQHLGRDRLRRPVRHRRRWTASWCCRCYNRADRRGHASATAALPRPARCRCGRC